MGPSARRETWLQQCTMLSWWRLEGTQQRLVMLAYLILFRKCWMDDKEITTEIKIGKMSPRTASSFLMKGFPSNWTSLFPRSDSEFPTPLLSLLPDPTKDWEWLNPTVYSHLGDKVSIVDPVLSTMWQVFSKCFLGIWQKHWFKTIQGNKV